MIRFNIFLDEPLGCKKIYECSKRHSKYVPNTVKHTGVVNIGVCQKEEELDLLRGRGVKLLGSKIVGGSILEVLDWDGRNINSTEPKVSWTADNPDEDLQDDESAKYSGEPSN